MYQKSLEWAEGLRTDLVVRIEGLEAALADIEPLRQELERLQTQVKGVERMIGIYRGYLGYPKPSWASEAETSDESARLLENSIAPAQGASGAAQDIALIPQRVYDALMPESAPRKEPIFDIAAYRKTAAKVFLETRLWLVKQFLHRCAAP